LLSTTTLLARDAQAKLALIVAQIYPSVCVSVRDSFESMELSISIAANFAAIRLSAFFLN